MNTSPDLPEVPQPRRPFDPARLHKLEIAADSAYATTCALSARRDELRLERGKLATSIHNAEHPQGLGVHRPGAAPQESYDRLAFVEEQIHAVEAEIAAHHERAAPLRELAQRCIEWARRHSWKGNNAIGIPERPAADSPPPLHFAGPMPVTHPGPPPTSAQGNNAFGALMSHVAHLIGGSQHGR